MIRWDYGTHWFQFRNSQATFGKKANSYIKHGGNHNRWKYYLNGVAFFLTLTINLVTIQPTREKTLKQKLAPFSQLLIFIEGGIVDLYFLIIIFTHFKQVRINFFRALGSRGLRSCRRRRRSCRRRLRCGCRWSRSWCRVRTWNWRNPDPDSSPASTTSPPVSRTGHHSNDQHNH